MIEKVNLEAGFASFDDLWEPRIATTVDDYDVKLAKLEGEFHWHAHDGVDELFYVVAGRLRIELREQDDLVLEPGELAVVPAATQHRPVASQGCQVVFFERRGTVNTGDGAGIAGTTGIRLGKDAGR